MKVEASKIEDNGWFADETQLIEKWDWNASESERDGKGQIGYTDLNQPIITPLPDAVSKGDPNIVSPRYPIIDPRAKFSLSGTPPKETLNSSENRASSRASIARSRTSMTKPSKPRRGRRCSICRCR
jgi:hypothetical protein